ncbi:LysM peptidoglycan-binding domain-containing protein [Wenyingzhuangia sp. IMCC45574]
MKLLLGVFLTTASVFSQSSKPTLPAIEKDTTIVQETALVAGNEVIIDKDSLSKINELWLENLYKSPKVDSVFTLLKPVEQHNFTFDELSTDTLKYRLERLNEKTPFHIEYNKELERVIKSYLKYRKRYYPELMARADFYFPFFEEQLANYNVPLEVKYLAVVESALKPRAKSRVGATGMWQFMYRTGKNYNLKVSSYVDERQDPVKATKAACQFLSDLYSIYHDWDLALAAYNSGPGNVSKAIRRSGNRTNYWNIRPFLPKETAGYLPAFYATMYIFEYAKEHGIEKEPPRIHYFEVDSVQVKQLISFKQINHMVGTDMDLLEYLNPSYKLDMVPFVKGRNYKVALPVKDAIKFVDKEEEIYAYVNAQDKKRERPLPKYFEMSQRVRYSVRSGDFLGSIAGKFGVRVRDIKRWNNLSSDNLRIGQRLTIFPKKINYTVSKPKKETVQKVEVPKVGAKQYHTITEGDNLSYIAKKYKVTITALRSWNNLWKNDNLSLGQKLVIYKK